MAALMLVASVFLLGSTASAQSATCDINQFRTDDGIDITSYLQCVADANAGQDGTGGTGTDTGTGTGTGTGSAAATPTQSSGSLPYTGADAGRWAIVGVAFLAFGGAAVWSTRRRSADSAA